MEARFESAFVAALKKQSAIKKQVQKKVEMIIENPIALGKHLKGRRRGLIRPR
jgi:mRNA-degrading endonuclease RelE of RelBE toxin-antitoxin system